MNFFKKLFCATENRISRFHSERGELMPITAFIRLPFTIIERLNGGYKNYPWLVPSAVSWLDENIQSDWKIFEFGCGYSTIWYSKRCYSITGVEDYLEWFDFIKGKIVSSNIGNCDLIFTPSVSPLSIGDFQDDFFDLVIVDSAKNRVECAMASVSKIKKGGYLLFDDTDKLEYQDIDFLKKCNVLRFVGIKPTPLTCVETSLFQLP